LLAEPPLPAALPLATTTTSRCRFLGLLLAAAALSAALLPVTPGLVVTDILNAGREPGAPATHYWCSAANPLAVPVVRGAQTSLLAALAPVVPFVLSYCDALGLHVCNPGPFCRWANRACSKFCYARNSVRRWKDTRNRTSGRKYMLEAIQRDADDHEI
jgi:hypothetical protein